jgi:predicted nucleic acid-binding protein
MKILDSTLIIDLLRGDPGAVKKVSEIEDNGEVATTPINIYEVIFGIYKSTGNHEKRVSEAKKLLTRMETYPFDDKSAEEAARILGTLVRGGITVNALDVFVAAIAMTNGCESVVTRNKSHFDKIPGLKVETY